MARRERISNPDAKLARLMNRQLGTSLTRKQVRDFVLDNWTKVQALAHSLHDDYEDARRRVEDQELRDKALGRLPADNTGGYFIPSPPSQEGTT